MKTQVTSLRLIADNTKNTDRQYLSPYLVPLLYLFWLGDLSPSSEVPYQDQVLDYSEIAN